MELDPGGSPWRTAVPRVPPWPLSFLAEGAAAVGGLCPQVTELAMVWSGRPRSFAARECPLAKAEARKMLWGSRPGTHDLSYGSDPTSRRPAAPGPVLSAVPRLLWRAAMLCVPGSSDR